MEFAHFICRFTLFETGFVEYDASIFGLKMSADRIEQRLLFLGEHDVELKFQTEQMQADVMIGPNEWCQLFNQYIQPWSHHSELEVVIL